jgi:RNA polymerase sigma-70 factor (sigma-E family)
VLLGVDRYAGFEEFIQARAQQLTRYGYLLCLDAQLAEDLTQQALVALAKRWPRLREDNPEGYARRVILHAVIDRSRRRRVIREDVVERLPDAAGNVDATAVLDERLDLEGLLRSLPPKQRAVLVLRFYDDLTEAQTAATLGCSVGTVKSQTHHALNKLRLQLPVPGDEAAATGQEEMR